MNESILPCVPWTLVLVIGEAEMQFALHINLGSWFEVK